MQFNLSPSCINLFKQSPLIFYYTYISKEQPDTQTNDIYSISGNLTHDALEQYAIHKNKSKALEYFDAMWLAADLNKTAGFNGKPLNKQSYIDAVQRGFDIIDDIPQQLIVEKKIAVPLINDDKNHIEIRGMIDVISDDKRLIIDYKTSSAVDEGSAFELQGKHYAYLVYKEYGVIPDEVIFEYIKIRKSKTFKFIESDLLDYELFLQHFAQDIIKRGDDISQYEAGDYDTPFNGHIKKCRSEIEKRNKNIILTIDGAYVTLDKYISNLPGLVSQFSYQLKEAYWVKRAMAAKGVPNYDTTVRFYDTSKNRLPIGFLNRLTCYLKEQKYDVVLKDNRAPLKKYNMPGALYTYRLRDYQLDAVNFVMDRKITFLEMATSSGKTAIAAEIIRRNAGVTLFVVDRNVLLQQTVEVLKRELSQEIGIITEGDMSLKVINVGTIQTLIVLLKKKDARLLNFLSKVDTFIIDEAHVAATSCYIKLSKCISNATIRLGMSANYKREDGNEMAIEACVGCNEHKIDAQHLINEGYIMKPDIYFFKYNVLESDFDEYNLVYDQVIINNEIRNGLIVHLVQKFKDKNILLIINKIVHGEKLQQLLKCNFIHGSVSSEDRESWLGAMKSSSGNVIIGTSSIIGKGLDIPSLDIMINCTGNLSSIVTMQSLGRVLRKHDNKQNAIYIDFYDVGLYLKEHTEKRIEILKEQGHNIKIMKDRS